MWDSRAETGTVPPSATTAFAVVAQNAELAHRVARLVASTTGPDGWDAICWSQFAGVARWTWSHTGGRPTGNIWPLSSSVATSLTNESFMRASEYTTRGQWWCQRGGAVTQPRAARYGTPSPSTDRRPAGGPGEGVNPACRFRGPSLDASMQPGWARCRTRNRKELRTMRFMMLVIPKGYEKAAADFAPPAELVARMTKYNDSLTKAGVLLGLDGLRPLATGARVRFAGGKPKVTDGPFTEAKEVVGGYAVIQFESREEAIEAAVAFMRLHNEHWPSWEGECEVRPITFLAP